MPNEFETKPTLDTDFPRTDKLWTCPITGMVVPKEPDANLKWRAKMLAAAEEDTDLQDDLFTACSHSHLFFINAFCYTLRVFEPDAKSGKARQAQYAHLPFITWKIQDKHIDRLSQCIDDGEELLTDKSRDMGATWNHIATYVHRFLFRDAESHLMLSRKQEAVDGLVGSIRNYPHGPVADPGTLFGKIDYILSWLPEWMLPQMSRKKMHLVNLETKTRIDGESANATAGSSDRRTSIFLDEMAKMAEGESIKRSTRDVTACRLPCSTPNGAGTAYSKWRLSGMIPVFILPWWEHPEKGRGRYVVKDDLGRWKIRSPWYDTEETLRTPKELAIEVDMDHVGSGDTFFEGVILEEHRKLFAREPRATCSIHFKDNIPDADIPAILARMDRSKVVRRGRGPWRIWAPLVNGRLDQSKNYVLACDISKGMGASNSTCTIGCVETGEKVAEFADSTTPPYAFAKIICAAALWTGGAHRPLVIWENNGDPGFDFGQQIVKNYNYPYVYFARKAGTVSEKRGKRWGWRSSPETKAAALGMLRRAYAHGGFINHSEESLQEAMSYVHYEGGGIGPAEYVEESVSTRAAHGDRVIADMLFVLTLNDKPKARQKERHFPRRSVGHRIKQWKKKKKACRSASRFDFSGMKG